VRRFQHLIFCRADENELLLLRMLHGAPLLEKQEFGG
jgi:hypothetical protein